MLPPEALQRFIDGRTLLIFQIHFPQIASLYNTHYNQIQKKQYRVAAALLVKVLRK